MKAIPSPTLPDETVPLLMDGYAYISKRCAQLRTDVFQTRILLEKTICMRGQEAAALFYDQDKFQRAGSAPRRVLKTLFGEGGVQGLDGEAHRQRKALFMAQMSEVSIARLSKLFSDAWRAAIRRWERQDEVKLFDEARIILCAAVCEWAGVPVPQAALTRRAEELGAMIQEAGALGPSHWRGRIARHQAERWIGGLIDEVRRGTRAAPEGSALEAVAFHRDAGGIHLPTHVAAVELINILRPTVAIAYYVTFAALALHQHPSWRDTLLQGNDQEVERFVQEVRRLAPFFPFLAARVRRGFTWNGYAFEEGTRVLLDIYGTNHDPRIWQDPQSFRPDRFATWDGDPYSFIPQGGGEHHQHHRCPGEWITIALMKEASRLMTRAMAYEVPEQDLRVSLSQMPALPRSRFVIRNVRTLEG